MVDFSLQKEVELKKKTLEMEREAERQKKLFKDFADEQAQKIKRHHAAIAMLVHEDKMKTKYRDIEHFKAKMMQLQYRHSISSSALDMEASLVRDVCHEAAAPLNNNQLGIEIGRAHV